MPRLTLQAQIMRGLERLGYRREPYNPRRGGKYVVFVDHVRGDDRRLFIGKAGALRGGRSASDSIPLDGLKAKALAVGLPMKEPVA